MVCLVTRTLNVNKNSISQKLFLIFLIGLFLFYPLINKSSLSLMNCISLDNSNRSFLIQSPNTECWNDFHYITLFTLGTVGIGFFGIGYPLSLWLLIWKHKKYFENNKDLAFLSKKGTFQNERSRQVELQLIQDTTTKDGSPVLPRNSIKKSIEM